MSTDLAVRQELVAALQRASAWVLDAEQDANLDELIKFHTAAMALTLITRRAISRTIRQSVAS